MLTDQGVNRGRGPMMAWICWRGAKSAQLGEHELGQICHSSGQTGRDDTTVNSGVTVVIAGSRRLGATRMTYAADVQGHGTHCAGSAVGDSFAVAPQKAVRRGSVPPLGGA